MGRVWIHQRRRSLRGENLRMGQKRKRRRRDLRRLRQKVRSWRRRRSLTPRRGN
jgi:hypothetical protein